MDKTGLIPARFVTLIGHFVMLIMATNCRMCLMHLASICFHFLSLMDLFSYLMTVSLIQDTNVRACLPYNYDNEDYIEKDRELLIGIIVALAFLGAEMFGFLFGFSMFMPLIGTISVAGHFSACVSLSYWLIDTWDCALFWWVFFFCSLIPGCIEISIITNMLVVKRIVC